MKGIPGLDVNIIAVLLGLEHLLQLALLAGLSLVNRRVLSSVCSACSLRIILSKRVVIPGKGHCCRALQIPFPWHLQAYRQFCFKLSFSVNQLRQTPFDIFLKENKAFKVPSG